VRRLIALAAAAAAAATVIAAPGAVAAPAECGSEGNPSLGIVPVSASGRTFYIDDRNFVLGNGTWIYEETNGKGNLQRKAGNGSDAPVIGKTLTDNGSTEICTDDGHGSTWTKADSMWF
jgi:hypothetical protein